MPVDLLGSIAGNVLTLRCQHSALGRLIICPVSYTHLFKGVYLCAQAVARDMVARKEGVIINMSSECGLEGSEGQSIYAATKAAVNALTRSWAKELGKHNVRVVGVAPGILEATGLRLSLIHIYWPQ